MKFELVHEFEGYKDYELALPDNEQGIGGRIQITLNDNTEDNDGVPSAYGVIRFDNVQGEELLHRDFPITRELAEQLVCPNKKGVQP
jgi:hypothetical protein